MVALCNLLLKALEPPFSAPKRPFPTYPPFDSRPGPPPLIATSEGRGLLLPGLSRPILEVFP